MQTSEQGFALIRKFEGFSPVPYMCPAGKRTIGFGHVIQPGEQSEGLTEADILLKGDVLGPAKAISYHVKVSIAQGEFDALIFLFIILYWNSSL